MEKCLNLFKGKVAQKNNLKATYGNISEFLERIRICRGVMDQSLRKKEHGGQMVRNYKNNSM